MKLPGGILLLLTALWTANTLARERREHGRLREELSFLLSLLATEIASAHCSTVQALSSCERESKVLHSFFGLCRSAVERGESLSRTWREQTQLLPLTAEEKAELQTLAELLGRYPEEEQAIYLRRCSERFHRESTRARERYASERSIVYALSLSAAVLAVIVLM